MILFGAANRPPMLDNDLYDSWKSRMKLYMQNREHERMILESVENGPLTWPTVEENEAINIIPQGLPADIYSLVNRHIVVKDLWVRVQLLMQGTSLTKQERECKLKFMTDVKLEKDLNTTNFDQLHAYLEQHELHANEVHLLRERNQDPLAFVVNQQMTLLHFNTYQSSYNNPQLQQQLPSSQYGSIHPTQHYSSTYPPQPYFNHSSVQPSYPYQSQMNHQTSSILQIDYQLPQAIAFLIAVASSRFPSTNNQLRTSSNPRNQATIQDGKFWGNNASGQARIVKCYNCQGEGHMARQCTQPKRPRNATWYKDKAILAEAQKAGQILDEEQLAFLADPGVLDGQVVQTIIPNNVAFQTEDLDTYDFKCDDVSNAKAVLMANISN
nr:hypothetical protein [Tanacetum cinerariifolium]